MQQPSSFRNLFSRIFPRKHTANETKNFDIKQWEHLSPEQKIKLTDQHLAQGEIALLNDDLSALEHFESAASISPNQFEVWYRQGLSFFDYGMRFKKEKALLIASRYFKLASQISSDRFELWAIWGSVLLQLGLAYNEHHYYLESKEKLQRAIDFNRAVSKNVLASVYWDYGLVWTELAQRSGEAVDIRLSIQAFQTSLEYQETPPPEFLNDCGNAYLQMGLLINDPRLYLQAVDYLLRAIKSDQTYIDGWISLANAYSQLYINTLDEHYATKANECYEHLCQCEPTNSDHWLGWAQILSESGKQNRDSKKICLAIEKCIRSHSINPEQALLLSQWVESLAELGVLSNRLDLLIEAEEKILKATDQFPDDPDLWLAYGLCMTAFGQYYADPTYFEQAIEKLQFGLSLDRTHAEIWHALAVAHLKTAHLTNDLDMIERSTRFFARAIDLKPSCPSLIFDSANAYLLAFELHDDEAELDHALKLYESLLQNQKEALLNHPEWMFQYAIALEWLGENTDDDNHYIRAIDLYFHVLLLEPETPKIHFHIGVCLTRLYESSLENEYLKRALHHFRFALKQDEEDDEVWLEWGIACIILGTQAHDPQITNQCFTDAEQKLLRAGQLGHLSAYYNLAGLYSITSRYAEAMEFLQKAEKSNVLPPIEEMLDDEWLDNLKQTEIFAQFLANLETRHRNGPSD